MQILLVRHGKTQGNLEGRYVGRTDEPLLEAERERLQTSDFRQFRPDIVYCSRMLRCKQTADILFCSEIRICDGLEETDFGEFEYKNYEELNGIPAYQAWIDSGGMLAFPGGESGKEFRKRCCRAFEECIQDACGKRTECIAFVVHGGTIMSVMEEYADPKADFYSWQVKNGDGFLLELLRVNEERPSLKMIEKISASHCLTSER